MSESLPPVHFATAADFRRWLEKNHRTATALVVGFFKTASGKGGLTYPQAVDEMLCFGWIDGVKRRVDDLSYSHRITPRRPGSIWSSINVRNARRLIKAGKMRAAGLKAFKARSAEKTGIYSFEKRRRRLPSSLAKTFQLNQAAWARWQALPPGYQRVAIHWVTSAKQVATRLRRLDRLIGLTEQSRRLF